MSDYKNVTAATVVADRIREYNHHDGRWMCFVGDELVGRGTHLNGFVAVMSRDYAKQVNDLSIGRAVGNDIEIAVLDGLTFDGVLTNVR